MNADGTKLDAAGKPENSPITWNRCLHGYIFPKLDLSNTDYIDFEMIEQPLKDVIVFYQSFQRYKERIEMELSNA